MANLPSKTWIVEYARSAKSSCKACNKRIAMETLRFGKMIKSRKFDGVIPVWNHAACILGKANKIKSVGDVVGLDMLRWEDQRKIMQYINNGGGGANISLQSNCSAAAAASVVHVQCGVEVSKTSRATCPFCTQKIAKKEIRISTQSVSGRARSLSWHHAKCYLKLEASSTSDVEKFSGWESLSSPDRAALVSLVKKSETTCGRGAKRKRSGLKGDQKQAKAAKPGQDISSSNTVSGNETENLEEEAPVQENKLEKQTNSLWALKDNLKKYVTVSGLRKMLIANDQDPRGSELDLRQRCADGMLFGALAKCPFCSGWLNWSLGFYRCSGYVSEFTKCTHSTSEPRRIEGEWKIPEEISNQYLLQWFKSQKLEKPKQIFRPTARVAPGQADSGPSRSSKVLLDPGKTHSMATIKVKGISAVDKSSDLVDSGHILEDEDGIYNTTLTMSDLSTGANSSYILQIIEDENSSAYYLFRKWGRVGDKRIGGNILEQMSKPDAIKEFKHFFQHYTGNPWKGWGQDKNFQKQHGKYNQLEIGYEFKVPKKQLDFTSSQLASPLVELMKMLSNAEIYRAAIREFEIDTLKMPLGKLTKTSIQKGFEALTQIEKMLSSSAQDPSVKQSLLDASNRFFSIIPSKDLQVIDDEKKFKSKMKMMEDLRDIEIATELVGFESHDADRCDTVDEMYEKLRCLISPLSHDTEDFRLIEKYLHTTHAPTHTKWTLEVEEVFCIDREGEMDKYAPYRAKLKNKMLLWHGSRLTNFVRILSQGLRIAPPEAPPTGYMFGKGLYFADLGSKSAKYCRANRGNPVGLMLLSEVALGEVYVQTEANNKMVKPPEGKHSTKGLGKTKPLESEYVKWRDEVVVPCGTPVASEVESTELKHNEYVVYDPAQVKLQFLVKVRFHFTEENEENKKRKRVPMERVTRKWVRPHQ